jgi:hypothetical protein
MTETRPKIPTSLTEAQIFRLFKCAVKDDVTLIDAIIEGLYRTMKDFDAIRANDTVELVVDRDATAGSKFRALLDDLWTRRSASGLRA